jgi:hypothetical protein
VTGREHGQDRRICPECEKPIWEDATEDERKQEPPFTCSPLRCSAWKLVGKATKPHPLTGNRTMLRVVTESSSPDREGAE